MGLLTWLSNPISAVAEGIFGAQQASANRKFQREMSNTAMQRRVADLQAAGLNPMLAGLNQQGADSPGGSMASTPNLSSAVGQANSQRLSKSQISQQNFQIATQANLANSAADLNRAQAEAVRRGFVNIPYQQTAGIASAGASNQTVENLKAQIPEIAERIRSIAMDVRLKGQQSEQAAKMNPLLVELQGIVNQLRRSELPKAGVKAGLWGIPAAIARGTADIGDRASALLKRGNDIAKMSIQDWIDFFSEEK